MRKCLALLLAAGLALSACDDPGSPSTTGTLVIVTATGGGDPDPNGYQLTIDGENSLDLDPTGIAEVSVAPGRHTLQLLGVADYCAVAPGTSLEVAVTARATVQVSFEVDCPETFVQVRVSTTGLDIDPDGYLVVVDGSNREPVAVSGSVLIRLAPGSRTIGLSGLSGNCAIDGPASHPVTVADADVAPVDFSVVCSSTSGVVAVTVEASGSGVDGGYDATMDRSRTFRVRLNGPTYLTEVLPGDHVVSLTAPVNCSVEPDRQRVTVTAGRLVRDTVEAAFLVTCTAGPRDISGRWRIIFDVNEQHAGLGIATLTQGTPNFAGSAGITGTVTNSISGASCYSGTITPGAFPSPSSIKGDSVVLEIHGSGTVVFRGTVSEGGTGIIGRHETFGGPCDGLSGGACLGRDIGSSCRVPPFVRREDGQ